MGESGKHMILLAVVVALQLLFMMNFELSASRLARDLELSQKRVHELQARIASVERSALACYNTLNATELRIVHESRIINEETRELRNLTMRRRAEHDELLQLHNTITELNASLSKSKISLRYEMEERIAAEKAAQASQSSVQVVKDQLQNSQDELKGLKENFNRQAAKAQRKLSKAEKKAKDEESKRQKYMEGMINLQSKLGHTKSLLENAAIDAADAPEKMRKAKHPQPEDSDEDGLAPVY